MNRERPQGRRPWIGITVDMVEPSGKSAARYELKSAYAEAVDIAGGIPILLPIIDGGFLMDRWVDRIDGLVISGGAFDIPPERYGMAPHDRLGPTKAQRTDFELELFRRAMGRGIAVLGVCGGMQLINVALGGTLIQDIAAQWDSAVPHQQEHDRAQPQHPVEVRRETLLASAVGRGALMVNSTHHQAIARVAAGLQISAVAPDGLPEAIESTKRGPAFLMGVQWHPEMMLKTVPAHVGIYRSFVNAAQRRQRSPRHRRTA